MSQTVTNVSSWKDRDDRTWSTSISVTTIARVKEATGVNLLDIVEGKLLPQFLDDPLLLVEVLYVISKSQVDERNVSQDAFGDLFIGDVTVDAVNALVQGLLDFFPSGRREMIQRLWQATERAQNEAVKMATSKLNSPLVEQALTGAIKKASDEIDQQLKQFGDTSTNSPASSESTPAP
jgi:hypothetical protein